MIFDVYSIYLIYKFEFAICSKRQATCLTGHKSFDFGSDDSNIYLIKCIFLSVHLIEWYISAKQASCTSKLHIYSRMCAVYVMVDLNSRCWCGVRAQGHDIFVRNKQKIREEREGEITGASGFPELQLAALVALFRLNGNENKRIPIPDCVIHRPIQCLVPACREIHRHTHSPSATHFSRRFLIFNSSSVWVGFNYLFIYLYVHFHVNAENGDREL